jgi:hypothetical protein
MRMRHPALWFDLAVKGALLGLLLLVVVWPGLPQFDGKPMVWRAMTYPLSVLVVPTGWWLAGRRRTGAYPYALDIMLPLPLVLDTAGPGLYNSIGWWDKFMHFVSWGVLTAASVLLLARFPIKRAVAGALAVGFAAVTAILWEFGEYLAWTRYSPYLLQGAYTDALGDLAFGLAGTILGADITSALARPVRKETGRAAFNGARGLDGGRVSWRTTRAQRRYSRQEPLGRPTIEER